MAITFVLQSRGANHLVYLASSSGGGGALDSGKIQLTGAGNADVTVRAAAVPPAGANYNAGLLKEVVDIVTASVARAERQLLDWGLAPVVSDGIFNVQGKRCRAYIVPILPSGGEVQKRWAIDANTTEYAVKCTDVGTARALVVIEAIGTPLQF